MSAKNEADISALQKDVQQLQALMAQALQAIMELQGDSHAAVEGDDITPQVRNGKAKAKKAYR